MGSFFSDPSPRPTANGDPTPKYLRICREITEAIESGRLRPGEALPSQREMADYFGVTLMTVRQALGLLAEQQLLTIKHGRGTFIADRAYRLPLDGLSSFAQQIVDAGRSLRSEIISAEDRDAPLGVRARMGLEDDVVFCITRLRWVDEVPLVYSMSLLPPKVGHQLNLELLADHSLYDALALQLEIVVNRAVETFWASALGGDNAAALRRPVGSPGLVSSRLTYTRDGQPIVDDRAFMPGDRVVVSTERRVDDLAINLRLRVDDPLFVNPKMTAQEIP